MSTFVVKIHRIKIEQHPNADALECAVVGDYRSIVQKGQYKDGDLVAYIPEAAIVPDWLIAKLNLEGRLAGSDKNRVKAVRLRGIVSQGLVAPCDWHQEIDPDVFHQVIEVWSMHCEDVDKRQIVKEGDEVTEFLGITKWEPPIPIHMAGEVRALHGYTISYDIENYKMYPDIIADGEDVVMTEKLHGTWACFGWHPDAGHIVTSKGLSKGGLCFKLEVEANQNNLYIRTMKQVGANMREPTEWPAIAVYQHLALERERRPVYLLGEIFGAGVQDLHYGAKSPTFRLFDVYVGRPDRSFDMPTNHGRYLGFDELEILSEDLGIPLVPVLYRGPFSKSVLTEHTNGTETFSNQGLNIREGVIVRSGVERYAPNVGRVQLKSVSDAYLFRKNGTEFN